MDNKTREEAKQKIREAKTILREMEERDKRALRIKMILMGFALIALSIASLVQVYTWLPTVTNPIVIEALSGLLFPSYGILTLATILVIVGFMPDKYLDRLGNAIKAKFFGEVAIPPKGGSNP